VLRPGHERAVAALRPRRFPGSPRTLEERQSSCSQGGALLAAYDVRRATRDLDFQAKRVANDPSIILSLVREIASVGRADGLAFEPHTATSAVIREGDAYHGVRVKLPCTLASARVGFGVDVNVGDPIWPGPEALVVPRLLGGTITVAGYPLPMVYAEKLVTMLQRAPPIPGGGTSPTSISCQESTRLPPPLSVGP